MTEPIRIAMWSGPRNISTAMMRSFGARPDTTVIDEPFYAAYLSMTGINHPMREEVLVSQPNDWRDVIANLVGPIPNGKAIYYQKHMTHHMLDAIDRDWLRYCRNAFLIRDPALVLASYVEKRTEVNLNDIGIVQQRELFEREANRLGSAPPVIDSVDVLVNPERALRLICSALSINFTPAMLSWSAGRRDTDGVWAPAWYSGVEKSTGFAPYVERVTVLNDALKRIADDALPHYLALAEHRLR
ncbi:MAG TPA: hypothetical protein VET48_02395 [Steroidobacteraceae bacterium]|nr:hypothetical protein [Steroidobacteraceae bacterium]